jgi:murein L,D-transpeptidase YafK
MIRTTVLRVLVLTALAAAWTPVTCLGQSPDQDSKQLPAEGAKKLPAKATKKLPSELLALLQQKKMPIHSPILVRVFKEEAELEVWKQDTTGRFQILNTYPICRWSGDLGPKLWEGDRQTPEGFYRVTPELMNPHSSFYLSMNIGSQRLRQGEQTRRQLAHDPWRLLVGRLLCHDR